MKRYVIGRLKVKPGTRAEFMMHAVQYTRTSRAEDGCIYYDQAYDAENEDAIVMVECWATPEQHIAHTKAPHFAAFGPTFEKYVLSAHFEEMDVADVHDVVVGS